MSEWQPIESAPRDGTSILIADHSTTYGVGWFNNRGEIRFHDRNSRDGVIENGWIKGFGPTHWMPLPDPPAEPKESAA